MAIMTTFLLLLGSVLSLSSVVNGGNHLWERPFIATNNDTHHHSIHKRQLVIVPGDGVGIWLSRTIKYCFANTQSADRMGAFIVSAMTVWWGSGLPQGQDGFKMELVKDSQCRKNRKDVLLITYNSDGILTSSVGKISADPSKQIDGTFMYLSDRIDVGMKDVTANVAHEIGHAWGLHHEHQNMLFWDHPYIPPTMMAQGNSPFRFYPQNLKDYDSMQARYASQPEIWKEMTTKQSKAKANGFSAAEFLPLPGGTGRSTVGIQQGSLHQNVDWQSIMLYQSFAGGKDDGQGGKLPVLRMIDDKGHLTNIGEKLTPSQADTQAIIQLCNVHESTTPGPLGIESPGHPMFSKFKGILKKKNC